MVRRGVKGLVSPELRVTNDVLVSEPWRGSHDSTTRTDSSAKPGRRISWRLGGLPDPVHRQVVAVGEFSAQLLTMLGSSACSAIGWG